jgi:voltage-gated potassium channel
MTLVCFGTLGYYTVGHGRWALSDCAYMTIITVSTVGFDELTHMHETPGAREITVTLIVAGIGTLAYVQGNLTALLVEGVIGQALRRNRMRKNIESLKNHVVVAGAGSTGRHVIEELHTTRTPFVVIDRDKEHLDRMSEEITEGTMLYIHGDATDDHTLVAANIEAARGVVAALTHDKDNLFVTLSARSLNAQAKIVAKIVDDHSAPKMLKAGATSTVNPTMIGGRRMVSELIRPEVTEFLDQMLRDKDKALRLSEVVINPGSKFVGVQLKDAPIRRETRLLVVAVRGSDRKFTYNPEPDMIIAEGTTLIVLGEAESVNKLQRIMDGAD